MTRKDEAFKVVWPAIEVFPSMLVEGVPIKEQAKKVLEEAAEIYATLDGIWDEDREDLWDYTDEMLEECADCMTAISNLIALMYVKWARRRFGNFAANMLSNITMRKYCSLVYNKNLQRGHYNIVNPDTGDCADKDGDIPHERLCRAVPHGYCIANGEKSSCRCWSCSECSYGWFVSDYDRQYRYCPNCGAKVVGE